MKVQVPGGLFKLRTQLTTDLSTEGEDCGPIACINAIRWSSCGHVGPKTRDRVAPWVKYVRRLARRRSGPFFVGGDTYEVLRHPELAERFRRNGMTPIEALYTYSMSWETMIRRLRSHQMVLLPHDYGTLHDGGAPTGSDSFRGDHIVCLLEADSVGGRIWTADGDSLFDGRRPRIPLGWQDARLSDFKKAAGQFGSPTVGYGQAIVITVKRSKRLT